MSRVISIAAVWLLAGGCAVDASPAGTSFRCGSEGRCPSGMQCVEGVCSAMGPSEVDAAVEPSSIQLTLVSAASGEAVAVFDGQTILLNRQEFENGGFSLLAESGDDRVDAVEFETLGGISRRSTTAPHYLTDSLEGAALEPFPYSFDEDELTVRALAGEEVVAEVKHPLAVRLDDIEPALQRVAIVASATGAELRSITTGEVTLSELPLNYNIQIDTLPAVVREVEVRLTPVPSSWTPAEQAEGKRSDRYAPYFVGGDDLEDSVELEPGSYDLDVTVYHPDGTSSVTAGFEFTVAP